MRHLARIALCLAFMLVFGNVIASENSLNDSFQNFWVESRLPTEDWGRAKNLVGQPEWAGWLRNRRLQLDNWMLSNNEEHDKSVGWMHDYIQSESGRFIPWSPESAAPAGTDAKRLAAWRAHVRSHNISQLREAARLYRLTGDARYLAWVRSQLNAYAANYATLKLQTWNGEARLFSQALDEAVHVFPLIEAVRLMGSAVSREEIRNWRTGLFVPITENLSRSCKNGSNITVWMVAAISAVAAEFEISEAKEFAMRSEYGLPKLLASGVSKDYFWFEMSLHYQDYVVKALAEWMYAIGIRGSQKNGIPDAEFQTIGKIAWGLMRAPLAVRFANMEQPMINDGTKLGRIPNQELWGFVWRVLPTSIGLTHAKLSRSWDTLLDQPPVLPATELPSVISQRVDGLYAAQLVGRNWQALMRYGQRSPWHAHQESLTYDLQFNGVWIFRDVGTVGYGSPLHANFFRRAQAQSVPVIDRDGQKPWPSAGRLVAFDAMALTAKAVHENYQPDINVSRALRIGDQRFFDRVEFELRKRAAPVGLVFNTPCTVEPISGVQANANDTLGDAGGFRYWTARRQFDVKPAIRLGLKCEGGEFVLNVSGDAIKLLFLAQTPDTQRPAKRQGIFLETDDVKNSFIEIVIEPR